MSSPLRVGCSLTASSKGSVSEHFADPFMDMASLAMPSTMKEALEWCEFICSANGTYASALLRVASYFVTDIEVVAAKTGGNRKIGREERQKYLDFLNDSLGINSVLRTVAMDYMVYGTSLTSVISPFRRYLSCGQCGWELPLKKLANTSEFRFEWRNYEFHAHCPKCKYSGAWSHTDRRAVDTGKIKVHRWSPHEIDILYDEPTGDKGYYWNIPEAYKQKIRRGDLFQLERAPWELLEAIKQQQGLLFDDDVVYSMTEEGLAGQQTQGWGFSRVLSNFRQAWYLQVLQRYNEAIAMDYVVPFRVITPESRQGPGGEINDPLMSMGMGTFRAQVEAMLNMRRRDPARWNVLPTPLQYQALGGDAKELAPRDLIELGESTLLSAIGVPVDFYRGSLTMQTAPAALRLFQAFWAPLVHGLNRFLAHTTDKVGQIMGWEPVVCRLKRVTHADDLNRQMAKLQLMMGGQTSRTSGLASVDMDFEEEERRKIEEEKIVAELQEDAQEDLEQAAVMSEMSQPQDPAAAGADGAPPGAGAPPAAGAPPTGSAVQQFMAGQPLLPNQPTTPVEMDSMAETIAAEALSLPDSQRQSFLIKLKKEDNIIHSLVSAKIEEIRNNAQLQGGEMVMQQQFSKQALLNKVREASRTRRARGSRL